ncbi:hypothetical protein ACERNI_09965 [Camelimonas sp. ID_303_24]
MAPAGGGNLPANPDMPEDRPAKAVTDRMTKPVAHNHAPRGAMAVHMMVVMAPGMRMRMVRRARPGMGRAMLGRTMLGQLDIGSRRQGSRAQRRGACAQGKA